MKKLLALAAAAIALMTAVGCNSIPSITGGEPEGTIKTDDCRAQVMLQEGSSETIGKKFTCAIQRSQSGKIMGGLCQAVETEGRACRVAYTYRKKPWRTCPEHSTLGFDDQCSPDLGYHQNWDGEIFADPPVENKPPARGFHQTYPPVENTKPAENQPVPDYPVTEIPLSGAENKTHENQPGPKDSDWKDVPPDPDKKPTPFG